jgi:hypothetical protein
MGKAYLNRIIQTTTGGGAEITGTSTLTGIYQETIESNDPVYSVEEPAVSGGSNWDTSITELSDPDDLPTNTSYGGVAFSNDGTYMSVAHSTSPYITIYKRSGDTFTKLSNPSTLPTGTGYGVAFSNDDTYMSVAHSDSPYITIYKTTVEASSSAYNKFYSAGNDISTISTNISSINALGYADSSGVIDDEKTITAIWKEIE